MNDREQELAAQGQQIYQNRICALKAEIEQLKAENAALTAMIGMKNDALTSYSEFYDRAARICGLPEDALPSEQTDNIILQRIREFDVLEPAQGWIPVSERLPEKGGMYWTTTLTGEVKDIPFAPTELMQDLWMRGIAAWMPLPARYTEASK